MIEKDTETLLNEVVFWFSWHVEKSHHAKLREFEDIIRRTCGGDPATVDKLMVRTAPSDRAYLTTAAEYLNNDKDGARAIGPQGLFHDWTGESAQNFREKYLTKMCTALDDCQAIADGVRAVMSAFQQVAQKAHVDAREVLTKVKAKQDALMAQQIEFLLKTVGAVADALSGFAPFAATMATKDLLGDMKVAITAVNYVANERGNISGLFEVAVLDSSLDAARQLRDATAVEIGRLGKMIDSVHTMLASDELKVPKPKIVTDREFHEDDFWDGDPNKIDDTSALV